MAKFNKGDKVRFTNAGNTAWYGVEGIVEEPRNAYSNNTIRLTVAPTGWASHFKVGDTANISDPSLELVEPAKPIAYGVLTVGDKVRYTGSLWTGLEGTVASFDSGYIDVLVTKLPENPSEHSNIRLGKTIATTVGGLGVSRYSLEKIYEEPKRFTFEDIQKGDTIRRTKKYKSGATEVREGVAEDKAKYYWADEGSNFILAYEKSYESGDVTLELLNRPEPEPVKEPWETAKAGDQLVTEADNVKRILTKREDGDWNTLILNNSDGNPQKGFHRTDKDVRALLQRARVSTKFIKA